MGAIRRLLDWFKYDRLNYYPALSVFDRDAALKRLKAYEREEREACKSWLMAANIAVGVFALVWLAAILWHPTAGIYMFAFQMLPMLFQYVLHRRIRSRVDAKVKAELQDGRLWKCVECDYDLRASESNCPECGAPVKAN